MGTKKLIKLFDPVVGIQEEKAIKKTLHNRFWASGSGIGNVLKFENEFNKYVGSNCCIALNSGTAALHLALSLVDIKNREVILPSLSFVSTAHAIVYNGGKPVFVDVDPDTLCLDPKMVKKAITKKSKVILPVHFAGMPANLEEIKAICDEFGLLLIEDAAHSAGAAYKNKKIGSHGMAVCFSFHPVKNLAMPSGGAITLNSERSDEMKTLLHTLRWCGISNRKGTIYDIDKLGWNFYMNEFSAAIGIEQLKKLDNLNDKRRSIAKRYSNEINLDSKMPFDNNCSYHFYWIQVEKRDKFMDQLLKNNIETGIHYRPIHQMKFYQTMKQKKITNLSNTENISKHIVSLPTHPNLTQDDVSWVIECVNRYC